MTLHCLLCLLRDDVVFLRCSVVATELVSLLGGRTCTNTGSAACRRVERDNTHTHYHAAHFVFTAMTETYDWQNMCVPCLLFSGRWSDVTLPTTAVHSTLQCSRWVWQVGGHRPPCRSTVGGSICTQAGCTRCPLIANYVNITRASDTPK